MSSAKHCKTTNQQKNISVVFTFIFKTVGTIGLDLPGPRPRRALAGPRSLRQKDFSHLHPQGPEEKSSR